MARLAEEGITTVICFTDPDVAALLHGEGHAAAVLPRVDRHRRGGHGLRHRRAAVRPAAVAARLRHPHAHREHGPAGQRGLRRVQVGAARPGAGRASPCSASTPACSRWRSAVQAAGPNLTPETFGAGLAELPRRHRARSARGGAAPATTRSRSTPRRSTGTPNRTSGFNGLPGTYVADQPALRGRASGRPESRRCSREPAR